MIKIWDFRGWISHREYFKIQGANATASRIFFYFSFAVKRGASVGTDQFLACLARTSNTKHGNLESNTKSEVDGYIPARESSKYSSRQQSWSQTW
jgi:hypothetical protein